MTAIDPRVWRLLTMRSALRLEMQGFKHSRGSVYALVKREFSFKGSKARVYAQLDARISRSYTVHENHRHHR